MAHYKDKLLHDEAGLPSDGITNKVDRASLINRCQQENVPLQVGMHITGHRSEAIYVAYNRSTNSAMQVATQKCIY